MKKLKNKILVIIFAIMCLLGIFAGVYSILAYSPLSEYTINVTDGSGNKRKIEDDYDLAQWAKNSTVNNNANFVESNLTDFIGKYINLYYGDSKGSHTISTSSAACMYHSQGGSEGGKYKIVNIVDFFGTSATVYPSGAKVPKPEMNGALLYAMNKAAEGDEEWKSAFKRLFFEHDSLLSKLNPGFKANANNDALTDSIQKKINKAKEEGKNFGDPSKKPTKGETSKKPSQNAKEYLGPFKVQTFGGYKVKNLELTIKNEGLLGELTEKKNVWIKDGDNYEKIAIDELEEGQAFYIKPDKKITGEWEVELNFISKGFKGRLVLLREKEFGGQNLAIYGAPTSTTDNAKLTWKGKPTPEKGNLKIIKVDKNNPDKTLAGAVFKVYNKDKTYVKGNLKTGEDGTITLEDLELGEYIVEEVTPPEGYSLASPASQRVNVYKEHNEDNPVEVKFENPENVGSLNIIKEDEKGNVLKDGFEFKIEGPSGYKKIAYLKDGKGYIDGKESGNNCIHIKGIALGTYKITETKAADGFSLDPEPKVVNVTEETPDVIYKFKNETEKPGKGKLTIVKKDKETGAKLIGARFSVFGLEEYDKTLDIYRYKYVKTDIEVTDKEGITLTNLEPGMYMILETKAPTGYEISDINPKHVSVTESKDGKPSPTEVVEFYDKKKPNPIEDEETLSGEIKVYKYDEDTNKSIEGAIFEIYQQKYEYHYEMHAGWSDGKSTQETSKYKKIGEMVTDENGYATTTVEKSYRHTQSEPGVYYIEDRIEYSYKIVEKGFKTGPYDINDQIYHYAHIDTDISDVKLVSADLGKMPEKGSGLYIQFKNKLYGNIELYKVDNDDYEGEKEEALPRAKFKFFYKDESGTKHYISSYTEMNNKETGEIEPSKVEFTTNEESAKEFITDEKGYIKLRKLPAHRTYYAIETGLVDEFKTDKQIDEEFYRLHKSDEEFEFDLENLDTTATAKVKITNQQAYTRLSGIVWEDKHDDSKKTLRNDVYDEGETKIEGIEVRLVYEGTDETVVSEDGEEFKTYTDENGYYEFKKVLKSELHKYNVKFKYNGLKYERVAGYTSDVNKINASKADDINRSAFNEQYAIIEKGVSKKSDRTDTNKLTYTNGERRSRLVQNLQYTAEEADYTGKVNPIGDSSATKIYADTSILNLADHLKLYSGDKFKEVKHINLGIYEKEQPDIALVKDIQNVRLTINGYEYTYDYAQRFINQGEYDAEDPEGMFNVGVKFGNKYGKMAYTRPVYKSDYKWQNPDEKTRELKSYITYKIRIKNESTALKTRVNSIIDYYDVDFEEISGVGTKLDEKGNISDKITYEVGEYNDKYRKVEIKTEELNNRINPQETQDIYIQFKINRARVEELINKNDKDLLDNVVEINSYSTFDMYNAVYAGIDKDSEPGNIVVGDDTTYEDDTDTAPTLKLETAKDARKIQGVVFLDDTKPDECQTLKIREGNGSLDSGEKKINDVKIKLIEQQTGMEYYIGKNQYTQSIGGETYKFKEYEYDYSEILKKGEWSYEDSKTAKMPIYKDDGNKEEEEGAFLITGFIPGTYKIEYMWGEESGGYNVQNYKGTVYQKERYDNINEKSSTEVENGKWYRGDGHDLHNENIRYTDAIDNYETRLTIDDEIKTTTNSLNINKHESGNPYKNKEMDSYTPLMKIGVEYDDINTASSGAEYVYLIKNIDFGIVRRAIQKIDFDKRVSHIRITLANGEVVSDVEIDEDGKLVGEKSHVTYMGPLNLDNGFVKVELDNEILQGAKIEVKYTFKFTNESEVDVVDEQYYKFGINVMPGTSSPEHDFKLEKIDASGNTIITKWANREDVVKIKPTTIVDYLDKEWGYEASKNEHWTAKTKEEFIANYKAKGLLIEDVIEGTTTDINNRVILITNTLANEKVEPGKNVSTTLDVSKQLTTTDDISLKNETEILQLDKEPNKGGPGKEGGGSEIIEITPGNHIPGTSIPGIAVGQPDEDTAETVIVTPSTGEDLGYGIWITLGVASLAILGIGIVVIKKVVL